MRKKKCVPFSSLAHRLLSLSKGTAASCQLNKIALVLFKVRSAALNIIKWMYEKDHLRDYVEKFALNYMQLLVHPNPPSLLFGVGEDTGQERLF